MATILFDFHFNGHIDDLYVSMWFLKNFIVKKEENANKYFEFNW